MIYFYRALYIWLKKILVVLKPLLPRKLQLWIDLRNQKIEKSHSFINTYWFHASSGEIEYCKSVIRLLKEQKPESQIVVTYSSPSAEKLFHNIRSYVDQFIPLCWDQPIYLQELIHYLSPKILIFSRTDLWPELITEAHKQNIKMGVIAFNPRFNFLRNILYKILLPKFNFISCTDENVKKQLQSIYDCNNVSVGGDTRFDQIFYRISQEPKLKVITDFKVFICGSTWHQDENVLLKSFAELIKNNFKIILSPHEVEHDNILRLEKELHRLSLSNQKLSNITDLQNIQFTKDVFIIDKIGYLADAYRRADIAFVGGSFKDKIHSVMEPLCCGLPVITGPYYKNSPEAVKYQNQYVFAVASPQELVLMVNKLLKIPKTEIIVEMQTNLNVSQKVLSVLLS